MSKSTESQGRGRPRIDDSMRQRIVDLYLIDAPRMSFRAVGREVGVATSTVSQVLRESGVVASKKKPSPRVIESTEKSTRPSLRAVAERAGVSVSTVSLALRENPRVAEKTRKLVRRIADEMNYEVHPYIGAQLAAVRRGRVRKLQANLAYLHSGFSFGRRTWSEWLEFPSGPKRYFEAARSAAKERGYNLEPVTFKEAGRSKKRLDQILKSRGVRGIILDAPAYVVSDHPFDFSDYATVALRDQNEVTTHVFGHDNFLNTLRCVCYLWRLGYRRIGFVASDAISLSTLFARESGIRHAQYHMIPDSLQVPILHLEHNLEALLKYMNTGERMAERNRHDSYEWVFSKNWKEFIPNVEAVLPDQLKVRQGILTRWIEENAPEVIICEDARMMDWLGDFGYSVPEDVGLVHININFDVEGWSGMKRANESIGVAAAENLCNAVELGHVGAPTIPSRQLFPGEWVEGKTTRKIENPLSSYTAQADRFIRRVLGEPIVD